MPGTAEPRNVTWNRGRSVAGALVAACLMLSTLGASAATTTSSHTAERAASMIVQSASGGATAAADAVRAVGGAVTHSLEIVGGVAADLTDPMIDRLKQMPGIWNITPNEKVGFHGWKGKDAYEPKRIQTVVRSDRLWRQGVKGQGVTVAVLDTGIHAAHPDLQGPNGPRVIACEDMTSEAGTEAECQDTFGHGTFMAGLVAGNGASSNGRYSGAAPEANLAAIKVAGYDGSTDIAKILAGVQWAVAHKDTYNIRVLNLSLGSDSAQDYRLSPLNYAAERAWNAGIVVVVSAGNSGPDGYTVMKPGDDPYVVTVGSSDDRGTYGVSDDLTPVFSSRGPTRSNGLAKPDVVSPGVHTTSLRSPGSAIDNNYGETARVGDGYFKGSGTSMSTATVSGVVAQILQANPSLDPDQVKHRLTSTARETADLEPMNVGHGIIDAYEAAISDSTERANQGLEASNGMGLLEADRGSLGFELQVVTPLGQASMRGEYTPMWSTDFVSLSNPLGLVPWNATSWKTDGWDATSWKATSWKTEDWTATSWKATSWKATSWKATSWKGTEWNNVDWEATSWKVDDWSATSWKATSWKSAWYAAAWD